MKTANRSTFLILSIIFQAVVIIILWMFFSLYIYNDPSSRWDPKISITLFIAIPAAVIGVTQLMVSAHIQRASYIKDYALRLRTDKELSESFHYLVYKFGNSLYAIYIKKPENRTSDEEKLLKEAQDGVSRDLMFFDPRTELGTPQERRLDNLLGFFDTIGYDYARNLLHMRDIAGVFGFHLDHLIQRDVITQYRTHITKQWPDMGSFHAEYDSPVPFRYLAQLIRAYIDFRKAETANTKN